MIAQMAFAMALLEFTHIIVVLLLLLVVLFTTDDVIKDQICIIGKLEYLWNKKRYRKKKNAIFLHFEKPLK